MNLNRYEMIDNCKALYENALIAAILLDEDFSILWSSSQAYKWLPDAEKDANYIKTLLELDEQKNIDRINNSIAQNKNYFVNIPTEYGKRCFVMIKKAAYYVLAATENYSSGTAACELTRQATLRFEDSYRAPMAAIFSALNMLRREAGKMENVDGTIQKIQILLDNAYKDTCCVNRIIENALDYYRLNTMTYPDYIETITLDIFFKEMMDEIANLIQPLSIPFSYEILNTNIVAVVDTTILEKVIAQLVSNACSFTRRGNRVRVKLWAEDDNAIITVTDSGIGITDENMEHIFDPYYTNAPTEKFVLRLGMGLPFVRLAMNQIGGSFQIASKPGVGTTATVTFPLSQNFPSSFKSLTPMSFQKRSFSSLHILLDRL